MTSWDAISRPEKAKARSYLLQGLGRLDSALFLPAADCLCIQQAIACGSISRSSRITAVEHNPLIVKSMQTTLRKLGVRKPVVVDDELHNVVLRDPVGFAFVDLNGGITAPVAQWMSRHLSRKLLPNATIAITLAYAWRRNPLMPLWHDLMREHTAYLEAIADELHSANYDIIENVALFRALFRRWTFKADYRLKYRDQPSVTMTAYRFSCFTPAKKGSEMASLTNAAYKAWETRLRNGWVHPSKRSEPVVVTASSPLTPAQKAALTRRKNAEAVAAKVARPIQPKPAAAAALTPSQKAWITRRARQQAQVNGAVKN